MFTLSMHDKFPSQLNWLDNKVYIDVSVVYKWKVWELSFVSEIYQALGIETKYRKGI